MCQSSWLTAGECMLLSCRIRTCIHLADCAIENAASLTLQAQGFEPATFQIYAPHPSPLKEMGMK